jgi:hypothetical protein
MGTLQTAQEGAVRIIRRAQVRDQPTPLAHLKTPISVIVQVLSALTEGVGINAATRLYSVSKNSIYRWQERLSGVKKPSSCLP